MPESIRACWIIFFYINKNLTQISLEELVENILQNKENDHIWFSYYAWPKFPSNEVNINSS